MKNIEDNDIYLLWRHYSLSVTDRKVLSLLYMPLVGFSSISLYLYFDALLGEKEYYQDSITNLVHNTGLDGFNFLMAREKLEAVGLLKTYKKKVNDKDQYVFDLQQPKDPKQFFSDVLLMSNFEKIVDNIELKKLKMLFGIEKKIDSSYQNISAKFEDFFNVNEQMFHEQTKENDYQTRINTPDTYFSYEEFKKNYEELEPFSSADSIPENIINLLAQSADLYHLTMETLAEKYVAALSSRGVFVENAFIKSIRSSAESTLKEADEEDKYVKYLGDSVVSKKLEAFSHYSPIEVLFHLTHVKPQLDDYELIEVLEKEYGLIPSVINVVIDFTLASTNGMFAKNYAKKIARTLVYNQANKDCYLAYMVLFKQVQNLKNKENDKSVPLKNISTTSPTIKPKKEFKNAEEDDETLPEISEDDLVF